MAGEQEPTIQAIVSEDAMKAEILIPAQFPRRQLTPTACHMALCAHGVEITKQVEHAVSKLVRQAPSLGKEFRAVVATARPPKHGSNGRINWSTELRPVNAKTMTESKPYVSVDEGQVIGQLIQPTLGQDGRDVRGRPIPAFSGQPVRTDLMEGVRLDDQGRLVAQKRGVIRQHEQGLCIRQLMVMHDLNPSHGAIDCPTDTVVEKDIVGQVNLKVHGQLEVHGQVGQADIECAGNMTVHGGIDGENQGRLTIAGTLRSPFIRRTSASIGGILELALEALDCHLSIHGPLEGCDASLVGGHTEVTRQIELAHLGSSDHAPTELLLGSVPSLEPYHAALRQMLQELENRCEQLRQQGGHGDQAAKQLQDMESRLAKADLIQQALSNRIARQRTVDVCVHQQVHAGVKLILGQQAYCIGQSLMGPIRIAQDASGHLTYQLSSQAAAPLSDVAEVKDLAA